MQKETVKTKRDSSALFDERYRWRHFCVSCAAWVRPRNVGSAVNGYRASLDLHYDPSLLGNVACCGVVDVYRVLVLVEQELAVVYGHPEGHFTPRVIEELKAKCGSESLNAPKYTAGLGTFFTLAETET